MAVKILLIFISLLLLPTPLFAQGIFGFDTSSPAAWFNSIYKWGVMIVGVLAVAAIVFAGITYLTSFGNPDAINTAKAVIGGAIAGLVLIGISYILLSMLDPRLVRFSTQVVPPINTSGIGNTGIGQDCRTTSQCSGTTTACVDVGGGNYECRVPDGGLCGGNNECVRGSKCFKSNIAASQKTCQPYSQKGENCVLGEDSCADGLVCRPPLIPNIEPGTGECEEP